MSFNYASEKRKFERLWARLEREYSEAGMDEKDIEEMRRCDWEVFKQERIYRTRVQEMPCESPQEDEDNSTLFKKFEAMSVLPSFEMNGRLEWVENIGDEALAKRLKSLPEADIELLTMYVFEFLTQTEIAGIYGISQKNISKKLKRIKKILREGV